MVESSVKKILILSANPTNTNKLRLDEEVREILAGLERARSRDQFEIITKWAVRPDDLRRGLLDYEPEIVHFSGHGTGNQGLALENNPGQIQLVSTESLARLFNLFKDKIECVFLNACVFSVSFSPDGQTLASASNDKTVILWDLKKTRQAAPPLIHTHIVKDVVFSPDGKTIATASEDKTVKLWSSRDYRLLETLNGHKGVVNSLSFNSQGNILAS